MLAVQVHTANNIRHTSEAAKYRILSKLIELGRLGTMVDGVSRLSHIEVLWFTLQLIDNHKASLPLGAKLGLIVRDKYARFVDMLPSFMQTTHDRPVFLLAAP